jgi:hypothetical protein
MKKLCVLLICAGSIVGCKSSSGPTLVNTNPTSIPPDSSLFTYAYSGTNPAVQLTEQVTIVDTTNSEFFADLVSDTIGGFSTTSNTLLSILSDGDITLQPDTLPLPIITHASESENIQSIPLKIEGEVGTGVIFSHTNYLGEETVTATGESFLCSKVSRTDSVLINFPNVDSLDDTLLNLTTFWYSTQLGYFVKEQEESSNDGGAMNEDWTRILTAYKLGK